jgi:hypothetical protein
MTNALARALRERRQLTTGLVQNSPDSYTYNSKTSEHNVRVFSSDGEPFIHCTCEAGFHNTPCYVAAHVALQRGIIRRVSNVSVGRFGTEAYGIGTDLFSTIDRILSGASDGPKPALEINIAAGQPVTIGGTSFTLQQAGVLKLFAAE